MPKGGKRSGAGRPKGSTGIQHKSTLTKEAARDALRTIVLEEMREMAAAQIAHAKGLSYLVTREKGTGKFIKVTEAMAQAWSENPEALEQQPIIEVWEKEPSVQAFTDLMNRALDKPKEQEQEVQANVTLRIKWQD